MRSRVLRSLGAALVAATVGMIVVAPSAQGERSPARWQRAPQGFVSPRGTRLVVDGKSFTFSGINVYNANSSGQCWFPMNAGPGLDEALAAAGGNAIRAWFFQGLATVDGRRDWTAFDHTLAVARAHRVKVIATLTDQWGACEPDGYKTVEWYRSGYRRRVAPGNVGSYRRFVAEVVGRYRDDPTIMMWQLVNEAEVKVRRGDPLCAADAAPVLERFVADVGGVVKRRDPWHLLSVGTIGEAECGTMGPEYEALHSMRVVDVCEYHDYEHRALVPGDQWRGLEAKLAQCRALDKPIFVGEMGVSTKTRGLATSLETRAQVYDHKIAAQRRRGVVGSMLWAWINTAEGGSKLPWYVFGPGDPALAVVSKWAPRSA